MTARCKQCADRGLVRVMYHDGAPEDLAVCQCATGQFYRRKGYARAWAAKQGYTPGQIVRIEDIPDEETTA